MNTIVKIFSIIVITMLLTSCNDFLNIQPKGVLLPKTAADYEYLLNSQTVLTLAESYPSFLTDDVFLPEESNGFPSIISVNQGVKNLYTFQSDVFGVSEPDEFYANAYHHIFYYNTVIMNVLDATEATENEKQSLRAEALLGRALEYLELVNSYAKNYDEKTATTDPGVPLVLDDNVNHENLKRATVEEIYNQMETDLKEALKFLPEMPKHNAFRGSKSAALGVLARLYLYKGNYQEALKYANDVLKQHAVLLNFNEHSVLDPFGFFGRLSLPDKSDSPENIYIRTPLKSTGLTFETFVSNDLMNIYDKEKDLRFRFYLTNTPFGLPTEDYMWLPCLEENVAIATPEMYLTAAECEARVGSKDRAMELINKLRENRIEGNSALSAATNDEALKLVLDERRRELAMRGCTRFIDLRRLNLDPRFAKTITRTVNGETISLPPNDPKYVLPIPAKVLRFNPDMKPNVR